MLCDIPQILSLCKALESANGADKEPANNLHEPIIVANSKKVENS